MKNEELQNVLDNFAQSKMANLSKHHISFLEKARRIVAYDLEGNHIKTYASINIAKEETGLKNILWCALRKIKHAKDIIWRYEDDTVTPEDLEIIRGNLKYQYKKFGAYDLQGNLVQSFSLLIDVRSFAKISNVKAIRTRLFTNSLKPYKGYIWKYIKD